jgi:integral membrane protein
MGEQFTPFRAERNVFVQDSLRKNGVILWASRGDSNYFCSMNLRTPLGQLRVLGLLEGSSLLLLMLIGVPLKWFANWPGIVKTVGPIHGVLFLLFVMSAIHVSIELKWHFRQLTWKVLLACIVPFGTFYVDRKYLKPMSEQEGK